MQKNDIVKETENNVLDVEEMAYYGEFELASSLLISWKQKAEEAQKTKTLKELLACANALARIGIYVNQMQARQREFNVQLGRFRMAKLEADAKAKKAIQELEDYKLEL
jgi:hypothetical protein